MKGSPPCSRHGHVSVAVGTDIYVHGGMAGTDMFDDLYRFNTGMPTTLVTKVITLLHLLTKYYLKKRMIKTKIKNDITVLCFIFLNNNCVISA